MSRLQQYKIVCIQTGQPAQYGRGKGKVPSDAANNLCKNWSCQDQQSRRIVHIQTDKPSQSMSYVACPHIHMWINDIVKHRLPHATNNLCGNWPCQDQQARRIVHIQADKPSQSMS